MGGILGQSNVGDENQNSANIEERIASRRAKSSRSTLVKFLEEIGYEDVFNDTEIKEIKGLFDKTQNDLTQHQQMMNQI